MSHQDFGHQRAETGIQVAETDAMKLLASLRNLGVEARPLPDCACTAVRALGAPPRLEAARTLRTPRFLR